MVALDERVDGILQERDQDVAKLTVDFCEKEREREIGGEDK
jgi:hypothetical protein